MTPTKKVVLITTTTAAAPIVANRFIGFDGKQAKANTPVFGVTPYDAAAGAKGAADAQGCAVTGDNNAAGTAVTAAEAAGSLIAVLLKG